MTDCGLPTDTTTCTEHNVAGCAVCIKHAGACDWGGCHEQAAFRATVRSRVTERVLEVRPLCVAHLVAFAAHETHGCLVDAISL